ncbi:MAG: SDR family NAD(P)-dependent oxidoreductase [Verrucomicrobiia bacterium]|jgi:3-oxoacyl-[acyl-carrier protein] reductase
MKLESKVALITGASRGVGAATAIQLAQEGCQVAINYHRSLEEAESVLEQILAKGGSAILAQGNVADDSDCRRIVSETFAAFGRLDVLINNAGTTRFIDFQNLEEVTDEVWSSIMDTNVKGVFQCARAATPHLKQSGDGIIVNVASIAGFIGAGSSIPYCASKAAVLNLTLSLARTLCPEIRVNAVAPGVIDGEWLRRGLGATFQSVIDKKAGEALLGKVCKPDDVATAILGLIHADLVTGQTLTVDGGASLGPAIASGIR